MSIRNLCKTLGDLIKNIVSEIDRSREQMFRILESVAVLEIYKDPKKFNLEKFKHSKKDDERRKSADQSCSQVNTSSSQKKKHSNSMRSSFSSSN